MPPTSQQCPPQERLFRQGNICNHRYVNITLPGELLGEIFVLLYERVERDGASFRGLTTYNTSLTLSHVCQQWRRVAFHTSKLWRYITLTSFDQKDLLSLFLSHSGEYRTRVHLLASCFSSPNMPTNRARTLSIDHIHARQIRALEFEDDKLMALILIPSEAKPLFHLDSLTVQFRLNARSSPIPEILMQTRKLILSRIQTALRVAQPTTPVTDLCVKTSDLSVVGELIKSLHSELTCLELGGITGRRIKPPSPLLHLTSLSLSHCIPRVWPDLSASFQCPSLCSLSVAICDRQFHPKRGDQRVLRDFITKLLHEFTNIDTFRLIMTSMHRAADILENLQVGTNTSLAPRLATLEVRRPDFRIDSYCQMCEPTPEIIALRLIEADSSSDEDVDPDDESGDEDGDDEVSSSHSLAQGDNLPSSGGALEEGSNESDGFDGYDSDSSDSDSDAYSSAGSDDDQFFPLPNIDFPAGIDLSSPILPSATYGILEPRMKGPLGWGLENLLSTVCFSRSLVDRESEMSYRECGIGLKIIEDDPDMG